MRKRPYIKLKWCLQALREPIYRSVQPDGRIRHFTSVREVGKYLRMARRCRMRSLTRTGTLLPCYAVLHTADPEGKHSMSRMRSSHCGAAVDHNIRRAV